MAKTSFETLWQGEVRRRRRMFKFAALVVAMLVSFAACVWFYVTQPLFSNPQPANQTLVSPTRLEAHVRTIEQRALFALRN